MLGLAVFAWAGTTSAQAQNNVSVIQNIKSSKGAIIRALGDPKPYSNPLPRPPAADHAMPEGRDPSLVPGGPQRSSGSSTKAYGSFGIPYSEGRAALGTSASSPTGLTTSYLSTTHPYSAIGKLTFTLGGGSAFCSATLILRSVIVTAAHCIQNFGSGSATFSNWVFTPGYYRAGVRTVKPYGEWTWATVARPTTWMNGTDTGAGSARNNDLAVIILEKNSSDQFLGDLNGHVYYGWNNYSFISSTRTGNLAVAAVTTLGYPGLLDGGNIMQRADGPTYTTTVSGAKQLYQGNPYTGGSSGGPWIVNFISQAPNYTGGAGPGTDAFPYMVIGVTSWGTADPNIPKDNYSSQFGQNVEFPQADTRGYGAGNIGALLNTACTTIKTGTSSTYEGLGYCD